MDQILNSYNCFNIIIIIITIVYIMQPEDALQGQFTPSSTFMWAQDQIKVATPVLQAFYSLSHLTISIVFKY